MVKIVEVSEETVIKPIEEVMVSSTIIGIAPKGKYEPKNDAVVADRTDGVQQLALARKEVILSHEQFGITSEKKDDGLTYCYDTSGRAICGAKLKNKNAYCQKSPVPTRNRCKLHGGGTPKGIASAHFSTGKYTKDIPSRLAARYEAALKDDRLLEVRDDIALIEMRIGDLVSRMDTGESGEVWSLLKGTYSDLRKAASSNDQAKFAEALSDMGRLINRGKQDYATWDEIFKAVGQNRRLRETEQKRLVQLQQVMTAEQAMSMLGFVVSTIKGRAYETLEKNDADKFLAAVTQDLNKYLASNQSFARG